MKRLLLYVKALRGRAHCCSTYSKIKTKSKSLLLSEYFIDVMINFIIFINFVFNLKIIIKLELLAQPVPDAFEQHTNFPCKSVLKNSSLKLH